jgi:hypothetical protein
MACCTAGNGVCVQFVKAAVDNKCMELPRSHAPGAQPYLWSCRDADADNQLFGFSVFGDGYRIVSKHSGLCLQDGGSLSLQSCATDSETQRFWPIPGGPSCSRKQQPMHAGQQPVMLAVQTRHSD